MHIRERSSISVAHTTSESMLQNQSRSESATHLKPRAARMPDTRDSTPGSFCTRQLSTWRVKGCVEGGGVLYLQGERR